MVNSVVTPAILPVAARDIRVHRAGRTVLGPLSVEIGAGGITILLGPNGSGKTTLLRALHGLERLNAGRIDWTVAEPKARGAQSFVFQTPIMMRRSVADCIAYPLMLRGVDAATARARAEAAAHDVGIGARLDLPARVLSGGEKQKLALARALVIEPQILFLDEPCANLDGQSTRDIEAILIRARDSGITIVMSTHNVGQARRLADSVLFLYRGALHDQGDAREFFANPKTAEGRAHIQGDILI